MKQPSRSSDTYASQAAGTGRKVRTSDCRNCLLMKSLRAAAVSSHTVHAICDRMWLNRVRRRQILYSEGNMASQFFAVRSGRVKLVKVNASGREHVTAVLESGDLFGFEAVFDNAYTTAAEALTDTELCLASGAELRKLMSEIPAIAVDLAKYLHHQLCRTRERQMSLGALGASAKLAAYILQNVSHRTDGDEDGPTVTDYLTLKELGGILGLSPETVCRVRGELSAEGVIETLPTGIRVRDFDSLHRLAGQ